MSNKPLTSWKSIAAVFNRDVRTVQRWEKEEGLPVHRHLHHSRPSVWANREDLDAWWRQRGTELTEADVRNAPNDETDPFPASRPPAIPRAWRLLRPVLIAAALVLAVMTSGSTGRATTLRIESAISLIGSVPGAASVDVRGAHDLNGDGIDDLVVHTDPSSEILIYFGSSMAIRHDPDVRVTATGESSVQGAPIGDIDGDGVSDMAFTVMYGEPETYHATGPTYLVRGRRVWPSRVDLPRDADTTLHVKPGPDIRLSVCLAPAGIDLNRDRLHDVVLGAADFSPGSGRSAGGVFVLFGRAAWPKSIDVVEAADITIHGSYTGHGLGARCAAGDFNADGWTDLALMAGEDSLWGLAGGRGRAYVMQGRAQWPATFDVERDALLRLMATQPTHWGGTPLLVDVNGDGRDDLVATLMAPAPPERARVVIVFGGRPPATRLTDADADVIIDSRTARFGDALATADVDGDGVADLLIGDPASGALRVIAGRARWRPRGGPPDYGALSFVAVAARLTGRRLAAGDFDGDGSVDVALDVDVERFGLLKPALPLAIEIRPDASPNVLVPGGVLAITISSRGVRPSDLDLSSLRAGGTPPSHVSWLDGGSRLQLYFDVSRLRVHPGATRLAVVGRTRAGVPVFGADTIVAAAPRLATAR